MPPNYFDYDTVLWEYENDAELFTLICVKGHFKDCPLRLDIRNLPQVVSNVPARERMNILYAIAAARHGRVANTCNRSENYVGYSTKFGDSAGDFSILHNYTVTEVKEIGLELGLPEKFIEKVPEDGLTGLSDEENLGFSYKTLDNFLLYRITPPYEVYKNIEQRHKRNLHKTEEMPICPFF